MKTSILSQARRTEYGAFVFAVPALMLAVVLGAGALTLTLGSTSAEPPPAVAAPAVEPVASTFIGA